MPGGVLTQSFDLNVVFQGFKEISQRFLHQVVSNLVWRLLHLTESDINAPNLGINLALSTSLERVKGLGLKFNCEVARPH